MAKWLLKYDSHKLKKGEVFEGETLPLWLVGKVVEIEEKFEVSTPDNHDLGETGETGETKNQGRGRKKKIQPEQSEGEQNGETQ